MRHDKRIAFSLIIASILIGALSLVMPKNKEKYLRDRFWAQKTFAPARYNVVVIGDSRVYRGVVPSIIEQRLPTMKVLNFGFSNGGLNPAMFAAARDKFLASAPKKVMVIGVSANCITGFTLKNEQFNQEKNRPREDIFERLYLNGLLYHFSSTTPEALKNKMLNKKSNWYYSNDYFSNGYVKSSKFPIDTMEAISSYIDDFTNYKVEDRYINTLVSQVKQWTLDGITVIGFRPPTTVPMRALEDTLGLYNEPLIREKFISAGAHWIDLKGSDYSTYDGSHLDVNSANKLSERIAEEIQKSTR